MSFEERNSVSGILISLISWGMMLTVISRRHELGLFDGPDGLMIWARTVLVLIGVSIAIGIVLTVLVTIGYAILSGEEKPLFLTDERDGQIGLRGLQVTLAVMSVGLIGGIAVLAYGWSILLVLNIILGACALGDLAGTLTKVVLYRRGLIA